MGAALLAILLLGAYASFERRAYTNIMETMTRGWMAAASWMRDELPDSSLIAVDAAGIVPYVTDFATIDMLGLTDRHIAHLVQPRLGEGLAGHEKFDPAYVLGREPDYVRVWIDAAGNPAAAGLQAYADVFLDQYQLREMVLMRPPLEGEVEVQTVGGFDARLHARGYIYGIFARRTEGAHDTVP